MVDSYLELPYMEHWGDLSPTPKPHGSEPRSLSPLELLMGVKGKQDICHYCFIKRKSKV